MKGFLLLFALAASFVVASARFEPFTPPTFINRPTVPSFDRYRFKREDLPEVPAFKHTIVSGKNGEIVAGGHVKLLPGHTWEPHLTVQGSYRYKREASPQDLGSFNVAVDQPLGRKSDPSLSADWQHNIWKGENGRLAATAAAQKFPGQKWDAQVGAQASMAFNHDRDTISAGFSNPITGPERRPSYNIDYQHNIWSGKEGQISAGVGVIKLPGQNWVPQFGVQGRFKRESGQPNQGSFNVAVDQPLGSSRREPTLDASWQHNIFNSKNAEITAGATVHKAPRQRWEPHLTVRGSYRYKREASPQDRGSFNVAVDQPLGRKSDPSLNADWQHNIWKGENGQLSANVAAQKFPGRNWDAQVGAQASMAFNHDRDTISAGFSNPITGPERRPSYNVDYQHNIWSGKEGQISAGVGAMKFPGQNWEPHFGVQGSLRFRRDTRQCKNGQNTAPKPEPQAGVLTSYRF